CCWTRCSERAPSGQWCRRLLARLPAQLLQPPARLLLLRCVERFLFLGAPEPDPVRRGERGLGFARLLLAHLVEIDDVGHGGLRTDARSVTRRRARGLAIRCAPRC